MARRLVGLTVSLNSLPVRLRLLLVGAERVGLGKNRGTEYGHCQ